MSKRIFYRLSCEKEDPGYMAYREAYWTGLIPVVYVDGRRVRLARTADPLLGVVDALVPDENGRASIDWNRRELDRMTIKGHVRIELMTRDEMDALGQ